ncbi:MAG: ABC transporter ATP-binding protein [Aequorivita sp.]
MEKLLVVNNVSKFFGDYKALSEVSIEVEKGSVFGLLGPNGAGKTTLIRIINQITLPDSGTVMLGGEPLRPHHIQYIGYLPEERGLYRTMKVGEQVLYLARLKGLTKSEAKERLKYWFDRLDIGDWWDKKIQELSKGMAQKIQFVVTVLHNPKLLIFDEPFSGFDPINANLIKDEILKLRDDGATIIFSTHRMESVEEMCDHIALIHKSRKILDGKLIDIKRQYKNNIYEIGLIAPDPTATSAALKEKFEVYPATFKSINDELQYKVKVPDAIATNDFVNFLTSQGQLTHFMEVIPSTSDIFIETIQKQKN